MSDSLWPHGLQHTRLPCLSPTPRACSNSYLLSRWCHPTISSSVISFSWKWKRAQSNSVHSLSCVQLFATPWTVAHQASLSITNTQSLLKLMSIESVMPSNHLILCHLLLLLPSIFPSIRVFSKESVLRIRWPRYWSFYFGSVLPMNIQDWFPLNSLGWSPCHPRVSEESSPTLQFKSINSSALSFLLLVLLLSHFSRVRLCVTP